MQYVVAVTFCPIKIGHDQPNLRSWLLRGLCLTGCPEKFLRRGKGKLAQILP